MDFSLLQTLAGATGMYTFLNMRRIRFTSHNVEPEAGAPYESKICAV
jgi:hypothetical protein